MGRAGRRPGRRPRRHGGGRLIVEPRPGGGSVFVFTLPAAEPT
jgi:signal transduction histidine kinase